MKTIKYEVSLSNGKDPFGLTNKSSSFPLTVFDKQTKASRFKEPYSSIQKSILSVNSTGNKTVIVSNSADIDIIDSSIKEGVFSRKVFIDAYSDARIDSILINGIKAPYEICPSSRTIVVAYTNDITCNVDIAFHDLESDPPNWTERYALESMPIFLPEYSAAYHSCSSFDDRFLTYTVKGNGLLEVVVNRPGALASCSGNLFSIKNTSGNIVYIEPCIHREYLPINNAPTVTEYNYASIPYNIITAVDELCDTISGSYIKTFNPNVILDENFVVKVINRSSNAVVKTITYDEIPIHDFNFEQGRLKYSIDKDCYCTASYRAISNKVLFTSIEDKDIYGDCTISFYAKPTRMVVNGKESFYDPELISIVKQKTRLESPSSLSNNQIKIQYSNNYKYTYVDLSFDSAEYDSRFGFKNESYNKAFFDLNEIENIKLLAFNNMSAWLSAGTIDLLNFNKPNNAYFNQNKALLKTDVIKYPNVKRFASSLVHFSIDGFYTEFVSAAGVYTLKSIAVPYFNYSIECKYGLSSYSFTLLTSQYKSIEDGLFLDAETNQDILNATKWIKTRSNDFEYPSLSDIDSIKIFSSTNGTTFSEEPVLFDGDGKLYAFVSNDPKSCAYGFIGKDGSKHFSNQILFD